MVHSLLLTLGLLTLRLFNMSFMYDNVTLSQYIGTCNYPHSSMPYFSLNYIVDDLSMSPTLSGYLIPLCVVEKTLSLLSLK